MTLLDMLDGRGNIIEASLYKSGKYANVTVETEDGEYTFSVSKAENDGNL